MKALKNIFAELDPIFHPKSLALIGASGKPGKIGRLFMERFLDTGFRELYPVNTGEGQVLGVKAYPNILDIPYPVDMALVLTPTGSALQAVKECTAKGVKLIVITTSGFGETGEKGKALELEMVRIARQHGTRIIGPNCVGIYCPSARLTFVLEAGKEPGSVGVVSQSGFFADYLTFVASANGIRFSKAISCGNEADLKAIDFLEYLGEDPETEMIVAYMEGVTDGRRLYNLSREISRKKPIIVWKGGMTPGGAHAAGSHTGALAGSRRVWEGALRQAGVVSVRSFEEVLDCLYAFYLQPLPKGRRVAIMSGPGSTAVATTDSCAELGLEVPRLSARTVKRLREVLPPVGVSAHNPVDLGLASVVGPHLYGDAVRILAKDENTDMMLLIGGVGGERLCTIVAEALAEAHTKKPLVVAVMAGTTQSLGRDIPLFLDRGISVYPEPLRGAKALSRLWEYARSRQRRLPVRERARHRIPPRIGAVEEALRQNRKVLSEHESKEVLRSYGIPVTREKETYDKAGFKKGLSEIGFPLVIKANGPEFTHKTEQGLVYLDIRNEKEAMAAFGQIMQKLGRGGSVLVQEMIVGKRELMVGLIGDEQFGPCVIFGFGGIFTEIFNDASLRVAPVNKADALDMIGEVKARNVLDAFRGMPPADVDQLADMLIKVGTIGLEQPHIREIDINPVLLSGGKPVAVDGLIVLDT